jgi:PAS domain S-box-containing protein
MTNAETRKKLLLYIPLLTFVVGLSLTFVWWRTLAHLDSSDSNVMLIGGGAVSFLLALAIFLMLEARRQSQKTAAAKVELERAQTNLRESENYNRGLVEKSPGFISTHDVEGRIITINPAGARALGYEPEEVIGRLISDFAAAEDKPFVPDYFARIRLKKEATAVFTLLTKNGEPRIWKCSSALFGKPGENQYVSGYAQDITKLKNTEKALEKSRVIFERFMNNSPAVSYIKDDTGKFVYASRHLSELFNVPLEDIYGKLDADFLPKEAAEEIRRKEKRIIESGAMEETLDDISMLDGEIHTWQSYKFPVEDGIGGHLVGGISFDISERRRMEVLFKETATVQEAILNSANYTLISTDADGVIQTFNRTAEKWLGYAAEEIVGKHTPAIIHIAEEVAARAQALTEELGYVIEPGFEAFVAKTRTQTVDEHEWTYLRKDGTQFPVLLSITALRDEKGEITGFLGIGSDITERRQMEADLKKARDAALESARMKSEFLANMSHEIRTPMNGIIGMTEIILDTSLDEFQRSSAETIRDSSDALLAIINDILDFSKIEAGKLRFETIDFNLQSTIENSVELFAESAANKQLELSALVNRDVPVELRGDPGRLRQILTNLIGNAVKFTAEGEIIVRVEKISETEKSSQLRFSVSDTGIGINPEAQKYLFQAFTQADGTTTRKFGGTGLGLTISKQLIEMMNGEISVESAPDKGSTFSFTADFEKRISGGIVTDGNASVMSETKASDQAGSPTPLVTRHTLEETRDKSLTRILVAEDNPVNRTLASLQLKRLGYRADVVANGRLAVQALKREKYSLILMDCQMPEMDGYAATAEIRRTERNGQHIPVIAVTANAMQGIKEKCLASGMDDYLAKPFKQNELHQIIERWTKPGTIGADGFNRIAPAAEKVLIPRTRDDDDVKTELFHSVKARLNDLESEIGGEEVWMIVGLFREDSAIRFENLQKAIAAENTAQVEFESHRLKGGCGNIGADYLADLCARIEEEAMGGQLRESFDLISEIKMSYSYLLEIFNERQA